LAGNNDNRQRRWLTPYVATSSIETTDTVETLLWCEL
jgi:hypothetical protein